MPYAIESLARAKRANEDGSFGWEIAALTIAGKKGEIVVARHEQPFTANPDKIPTLKPAFGPNGTVTAANASSISDGAAALVMMRASTAERLGAAPLARVVGHSTFAQAPARFATAPRLAPPVGTLQRLFERTGWAAFRHRPIRDQRGLRGGGDDRHEETRAAAQARQRQRWRLRAGPPDRRLGRAHPGHPLLGALRASGGKRGVASLCVGGGEATAMALELI